MIKLRLNTQECRQLEDLFKVTPDRRLRARCQAVLMAARGRRHRHMAEDLGVSVRTLQRWLNTYHARGLAGLQIRWASGRAAKIPEAWAPEILTWIQAGPAGCGLDRANWTYEELATHLYQTTGIAVRRTAMRDFCQRHGIRPYRPTYHYLRGDPQKQQVAREELAALKKSPGGRLRAAEPGRSPVSTGAHLTHDIGGEGVPPSGGDLG
jgi:transposase